MTVALNHTIVWSTDKQRSASFLAEILGLPEPTPFYGFMVVEVAHGLSLDYQTRSGPIAGQHYAFLVSEDEFDEIFGRIPRRASTTGPIPANGSPARSTMTTAGGACTSPTPTVTCSRSSPVRTEAAAEHPPLRRAARHMMVGRGEQSCARIWHSR